MQYSDSQREDGLVVIALLPENLGLELAHPTSLLQREEGGGDGSREDHLARVLALVRHPSVPTLLTDTSVIIPEVSVELSLALRPPSKGEENVVVGQVVLVDDLDDLGRVGGLDLGLGLLEPDPLHLAVPQPLDDLNEAGDAEDVVGADEGADLLVRRLELVAAVVDEGHDLAEGVRVDGGGEVELAEAGVPLHDLAEVGGGHEELAGVGGHPAAVAQGGEDAVVEAVTLAEGRGHHDVFLIFFFALG